jgi:hypothetical protein
VPAALTVVTVDHTHGTACSLQRYRGGVSAFTPGSAALMPPTVIPDLPGAYMAGDWIKQVRLASGWVGVQAANTCVVVCDQRPTLGACGTSPLVVHVCVYT